MLRDARRRPTNAESEYARNPWIAAYVFVLGLVAFPATAQTTSGDIWVEHGLVAAGKIIQTQMIGGEGEQGSVAAVSSDGTRVAYSVVRADIEDNVNVSTLWMMTKGMPESAKQIGEPVRGADGVNFAPRFSPGGLQLAHISNQSLVLESVAGTGSVTIKLDHTTDLVLGPGLTATSIRGFAWSPNGNQIALVVGVRKTAEIRSGVEVTATQSYSRDPNQARARLLVYDLKNRGWAAVSSESVNVDSFDWDPDGARIAFLGSSTELNALSYMNNDLYIAELTGGGVRKISLSAGFNKGPLWSPNGLWIAFQSQGGQVRYLADGRVGLYDLKRGVISYPAFDELGRLSGYRAVPLSWAPNSRSLLLSVPYHLSKQLFVLSVPQGKLRHLTERDDQNYYGAHYVGTGGEVVFLSDSLLDPANIYSSYVNQFKPKRLTGFASGLDQQDQEVELRQLSWPSRDSRWTVHGWLLLPKGSSGRPLPLLVYAEGGPSMISSSFGTGWQYPLHAFLANGIAVLIPNSRGRDGYGTEFQTTWEKERNPGQGPLEDDLGGVDYLVNSGIVDPNRVGLAGLSWGGYLAAYALTHTDRFKAILIDEAVSLDMVKEGFAVAGNPSYIEFSQQLGKGIPFGDAERLRSLSPLYQTANATTPTLLEFGANSLIQDGDAFFQGLQHFKVPSELISYPRTGHGATEPALLYDGARRDLEWFAHWVLGKPTHRMLVRYGPPNISEWNP